MKDLLTKEQLNQYVSDLKPDQWESRCAPLPVCLETAKGPDGIVLIRNSRQPEVVIQATPEEWEAFKK